MWKNVLGIVLLKHGPFLKHLFQSKQQHDGRRKPQGTDECL